MILLQLLINWGNVQFSYIPNITKLNRYGFINIFETSSVVYIWPSTDWTTRLIAYQMSLIWIAGFLSNNYYHKTNKYIWETTTYLNLVFLRTYIHLLQVYHDWPQLMAVFGCSIAQWFQTMAVTSSQNNKYTVFRHNSQPCCLCVIGRSAHRVPKFLFGNMGTTQGSLKRKNDFWLLGHHLGK